MQGGAAVTSRYVLFEDWCREHFGEGALSLEWDRTPYEDQERDRPRLYVNGHTENLWRAWLAGYSSRPGRSALGAQEVTSGSTS